MNLITCHRKYLERRCRQRDYDLADVMGCVVEQDGDQWTIDTKHPAYPRPRPGVAILKRYDALVKQKGPGSLPTREEVERRVAVCTTNDCGQFTGHGCKERTGSACQAGKRWFERVTVGTCKHWQP